MLFGRVLLDNDDWSIDVGLLGGMKVTKKSLGSTRRVPAEFRLYFQRMIETLGKQGVFIDPEDETFEELAEDFAAAVFDSGDRQQDFFDAYPAEEKAKQYLEPD